MQQAGADAEYPVKAVIAKRVAIAGEGRLVGTTLFLVSWEEVVSSGLSFMTCSFLALNDTIGIIWSCAPALEL